MREARLKEIKQQIFSCDKLKSHFEENPRDLQSLRQDKALHTVKLQPHLKDVPDYIIPPPLQRLVGNGKRRQKFNRNAAASGKTASQSKYQARADNPLLGMSMKKKKKK